MTTNYQRISGKNTGSDGTSGLFGPGSAAAPSLSFFSDPTTGLYLPAAGSLGVAIAGVNVANFDAGGYLVPSVIDPSTYYYVNDFTDAAGTANFAQNGNVVTCVVNSVTAPLMTASNVGVTYVNTSSIAQGGYIAIPNGIAIIKSTTLTYRWRMIVYIPAASTSANRYVAYVGGATYGSLATHASFALGGGPFLSYTDNANSSNWVMNSAVNGTGTSANSSTAPALNAWSAVQITLVNGTYTFVVNGVTIGTVTDTNITTSVTNGQSASPFGMACIPDGANFTTQRTVIVDRAEFYMTGMTR